jgi:KDO2-lipid IV(A) lauroyltransferase
MNLFSRAITQAGIGLMKLMAGWPLPWVRGLGAVLGLVLYALVLPRRRIVLTNLALCFPDMPEAERRRLARQSFVYFAQTWLDRSWLWHGSPEQLRQRLRLHGALQAFEGQRPTLVFCPHFYGLDAAATAINMNVDRDFTSIYTPQANALVDAWVKAGRLRMGRVRLFNRSDGVKEIVSALREGQVLYLLPDMDFGADGSVFVPFFGVPAATVPSISRFARLGRAQVLTVVPRLTPHGYDIELLPAWQNFPSGDLEADTVHGNRVLEGLVLGMPAQYFWVHKRFKSRPPGHAPVY